MTSQKNEKTGSNSLPRPSSHLAQRHFNTVEGAIEFLSSPRLYVESRNFGQKELFSSKPKGNAVEYKYFSPMESHRGDGSKNDPDFYEQNALWERYQKESGAPHSFWAWSDSHGWEMVTWAEFEKARAPRFNEWGEVGA